MRTSSLLDGQMNHNPAQVVLRADDFERFSHSAALIILRSVLAI